VHDENVTRSVAGIIDAASTSSIEALNIAFSQPSFAELQLEALRQALAPVATIEVVGTHERPSLRVELKAQVAVDSGAQEPPPRPQPVHGESRPAANPRPEKTDGQEPIPQALAPQYVEAVEAALHSIKHGGELSPTIGQVHLAVAEGEVSLHVNIDAQSHAICAARHQGARSRNEIALVETLCRLLPGLPVQEAADHGALRVERALRARAEDRPVPGVVMPENASLAFRLPLALTRKLVSAYTEATGYSGHANHFDPAPSKRWRATDRADRLAELAEATGRWCVEHGLSSDAVYPVEVLDDHRVIFALDEGPDRRRAQSLLMKLERSLQSQVEGTLELCLQEMRDRNKLRQLEARPSNRNDSR